MVHCISSSEPDSGDIQNPNDDWRIQGITTKELAMSQVGLQHGKTYVESTVTTGIQVGNHRVSPVTHRLTVDMHQPADTTHPEKTYVDSQENMDTSSPNHSTDTTTVTTKTPTTTANNNNHSLINNSGHYHSANYHPHNYIVPPDNDNVYRQQQQQVLVPDHADYTLLPGGNKLTREIQETSAPRSLNSLAEGETIVMEVEGPRELTLELNPQSYKSRNDTRHQQLHHQHHHQFQQRHHHHQQQLQHQQQNLLEQRQLGNMNSMSRNAVVSNGETYLLPATVTSQKVINFNNVEGVPPSSSTPGLYRHLYDINYRSDPNAIAVVDYHHHYHHHNPNPNSKTLFVVGNNNQYNYDDLSEDDSDDSSDDE